MPPAFYAPPATKVGRKATHALAAQVKNTKNAAQLTEPQGSADAYDAGLLPTSELLPDGGGAVPKHTLSFRELLLT